MATGTLLDFKIDPVIFYTGVAETLEQNGIVFNAAAVGVINLVSERVLGQFEKENFFQRTTDLISHRDPADVSDATPTGMTQEERYIAKIERSIGPIEQTLNSFKKVGVSVGQASLMLGREIGEAMSQDMFNTGLRGAKAAIEGAGALNVDISADPDPTLKTLDLISGLKTFGDAASRINAWVMHSKSAFDLLGNQITDLKIDSVAGVQVYGASPASFGRPIIVSDSEVLAYNDGGDRYDVLGLTMGAIELKESEERELVDETVTGKTNLIHRIQGEYAYNLKLKGFGWDETAGANPNDAAIATAANWLQVYLDDKDLLGCRVKHA